MGQLKQGQKRALIPATSIRELMMASSILPPAQGLAGPGAGPGSPLPSAHLLSSAGQDDQASDGQHLNDGVTMVQAFCHPPQRVFLGNPSHLLHLEELKSTGN